MRISKDRTGAGLGVARQRTDCAALAVSLGWQVVEVYEDNDISAYSGRRRPAYERMLADLDAGRMDAVIAWHPDRLHRRPAELEPFIEIIERTGALVRTCTAGELDLATASGRMVARMLGAAARHEVDHMIERIRAKKAETRAAGGVHGGSRPFGYDSASMRALHTEEARELREAAAGVLTGLTTAAIARDWNARRVLTTAGKPWNAATVRRVLTRPRNAAIVEHENEEVGPAMWPAILDEDTYRALRAILGDGMTPKRHHRRLPKMLLSDIARCGEILDGGELCGLVMHGAGSNAAGQRYRCSSRQHVLRQARPLDEHVENIVLRWLPTSEAVEFMTAGSVNGAALHAQASGIRARLDELGEAFAAGEIDRAQLRAGTERAKADLARVEEQTTTLSAGSVLVGLAGEVDAADRWAALSIDRKRAVIDAVFSIVVHRGKRGGSGGTRFDTSTISVTKKERPAF